VSIFSVHLYLLQDGELGVEVLIDKLLDLDGGTALLSKELVTWEGKDLESLVPEVLMHLDHCLIVG
jgi:hypothetical protein